MTPTNPARLGQTSALPAITIARTCLLASTLAVLTACSSSSDNDANDDTPALTGQTAFVASRAGYESGRIDRISLDAGNTVDGSYPTVSTSDIAVTTDGVRPYQIGRYQTDSITRYDAQDTSIVDYQYSVNDNDTESANPQAIAFADDNKAYLTRRSSSSLWIIDPAAETQENFKLDELDLSAYDSDFPDMTNAIIVDDKLFVLLERLTSLPSGSQISDKAGYVAVFNTITDTEIDTGMGSDGLLGIELPVTNPGSLQYNEETGLIYVVGRGNYYQNENVTEDFHSGGVVSIDPTSFEPTLILDDGNDDENQGYFTNIEVIDAEQAYLLTYADFSVSTLRSFNPTTGALSEDTFSELQDVDLTNIAQGPDNHLWVGINDDTPGFYRVDLSTGELAAERVATELTPMNLIFINITQP